ncbi:MAG: carboxypeptidase-like regulatory domain-containing protein [Bacteroidota bacterium]|nr:carboxypeptidase-like regulatory domain-containing protein [Bacteroidota bacterium]
MGTVNDSATGQPVPFCSFIIQGTLNGGMPDEKGVFSANVALPATLVFSALGYKTIAVLVTKKKFNRKRFKELLLSVQSMSFAEQEAFLQYALLNWRQDEPHVEPYIGGGCESLKFDFDCLLFKANWLDFFLKKL